MLSIVIVGTGWWGMELGKAAKSLPDPVRIAGCYSLSSSECAAFCSQLGGKAYASFEAVLSDSTVDAVFLATPHSTHVAQIVQAAAAGKHVFCEKPLALTTASATSAIEACDRAAVVLAVGHNRRCMPVAKTMKRLVDEGACGKIIHVEAHYSGHVEGKYPNDHWRVQQSELPAAALTPMGLHVVDTMMWILGPVARVASLVKHQVLSYKLNDTCAALFELECGATGTLGSNLACPSYSFLRLYGTKAIVEAKNHFSELEVTHLDPAAAKEHYRYFTDDSLRQEIAAFEAACGGRVPYPLPPSDALRNVAFLEAVQRSGASKGAWMTIQAGASTSTGFQPTG